MMGDTDMETEDVVSMNSSIGEAVSGRRPGSGSVDDDGDGQFYVPERRPSLDLGQNVDTSHWYFVDRAHSPALSYMSMKSADLAGETGDETFTRLQLSRTDSFSSCYSLDSDDCEKRTLKVTNKDGKSTEDSDKPDLTQEPNEFTHPSVTVDFTFKVISHTLGNLPLQSLSCFKMLLWERFPQSFNSAPASMDIINLVDRLLECYSLTVALTITVSLLGEMRHRKAAEELRHACVKNEVRYDLCQTLTRKYRNICVSVDAQASTEQWPMDDIYVEPCILSSGENGPNIQHEVMTIERLDTNKNQVKRLSPTDVFSHGDDDGTRITILSGVAGSGKSMVFRRVVLDWAEGRAHQHVTFLIPFSFRELKEQFDASNISLLEIVQTLYPETKKLKDKDYGSEMMLVCDGLDEVNEMLDFFHTTILCDHKQPSTLQDIVVNLLRGRMLFYSNMLVTSRPLVETYNHFDMFYQELEVQGFNDPEKEAYFKKRFKDPDQAAQVIAYVHSCKTLHVMCYLPMFCSLVADECQSIFRNPGTPLLRSTTYMYTKLILTLVHQHWGPDRDPDRERDFIMKLGKLALHMMEQKEFLITQYDWKEVGIADSIRELANSGLCMTFIIRPYPLTAERVLSFMHPTVQEYLAALYVFLSHRNLGKNIFEQQTKLRGLFKSAKVSDVYKCGVDRSLVCTDGRLDIFLRFLCGMAQSTNVELLRPFFNTSAEPSVVVEDIEHVIRKRIKDAKYPDRIGNLQRCLKELGV